MTPGSRRTPLSLLLTSLLIFGPALWTPSNAHASTVVAIGADGADGTPGSGNPGTDGDAAAASATDLTEERNVATATGGSGGDGASNPAGDGGNGGDGGAASTYANTEGDGRRTTSSGSTGGDGGAGADPNGLGGNGGDATASASGTSTGTIPSPFGLGARTEAAVFSSATGGAGLVGGDAAATSKASTDTGIATGFAKAVGGDGQAGGTATATSHSSSASGIAKSFAAATGGAGVQAADGSGGDGGDATANASVLTNHSGFSRQVEAIAEGGSGSTSLAGVGRDGGDARATAYGESTFSHQDVRDAARRSGLRVFATAVAGAGGSGATASGADGEAVATARGVAHGLMSVEVSTTTVGATNASAVDSVSGSSSVMVDLLQAVRATDSAESRLSDARSENGGFLKAATESTARHATASTYATDETGTGARAEAKAIGERQGTAHAVAEAHSLAGGYVTVKAEQHAGDVDMLNQVSGTTTGTLVLEQVAQTTSDSSATPIGHARSALSRTSGSESALTLNATAIGASPSNTASNAVGGSAEAEAVAERSGETDVNVVATATSGNGHGTGEAGAAMLGRVYGRSDSGDVSVSGTIQRGSSETDASASLVNAVAGDTTGALQLVQTVVAGGSSTVGGSAGSALEHAGTHSALELISTAVGGSGPQQGDARSIVDGWNGRGDIAVRSSATGGQAHAAGRAVGENDVALDVESIAGPGSESVATLGEIYAESMEGGDVQIGVTLSGGRTNIPAQNLDRGQDVSLNNTATALTTGAVELSQAAAGGDGHIGGNATSLLERHDSRSHLGLTTTARGGQSDSGFGGNAQSGNAAASSIGANSSGSVDVSASAYGNGAPLAAASSATATAVGIASGAHSANVAAHAESTAGVTSQGTADLGRVYGESETGDVVVEGSLYLGKSSPEAAGEAGTNVALDNRVSGSTRGSLSLTQNARAGSSSGGKGGDATSSLDRNGSFEALNLETVATGGSSSAPAFSGGNALGVSHAENGEGDANARAVAVGGDTAAGAAGDAHAEAVAIAYGSSAATASASATAGSADFGASGTAGLGRVFASSDSGDVSSSASLTGGNALGGTPPPVSLIDVADGATSGRLHLSQYADGGKMFGRVGAAAMSSITRNGSHRELELESTAIGVGQLFFPRSGPNNPVGGDAESRIHATNTGGDVILRGHARGGSASLGGDALLRLHGESYGDDASIRIGSDPFADPSPSDDLPRGAVGGDVGFGTTGTAWAGDADSESIGIAHGNSEVVVSDVATGGTVHSFRAPAVFLIGGTARSRAAGQNAGKERVFVSSAAIGGDADPQELHTPGGGTGGNAYSYASAIGQGLVGATSEAYAGNSSKAVAAEAIATSHAEGNEGFARAEAGVAAYKFRRFDVSVEQHFDKGAASVTSEVYGVSFPTTPLASLDDFDASARSIANVDAATSAAILSGRDEIAAKLGSEQLSLIAASELRVSPTTAGAHHTSHAIELMLDPNDGLLGDDLSLITLGSESEGGSGFESLRVRVLKTDIHPFVFTQTQLTLLDLVFTTLEDVSDFFNGTVLPLGDGFQGTALGFEHFGPSPESLEIYFDWAHHGADFSFIGDVGIARSIAQGVVPEPGTGILLSIGLLTLAARRRFVTRH